MQGITSNRLPHAARHKSSRFANIVRRCRERPLDLAVVTPAELFAIYWFDKTASPAGLALFLAGQPLRILRGKVFCFLRAAAHPWRIEPL
jgi:hypothetical protein